MKTTFKTAAFEEDLSNFHEVDHQSIDDLIQKCFEACVRVEGVKVQALTDEGYITRGCGDAEVEQYLESKREHVRCAVRRAFCKGGES